MGNVCCAGSKAPYIPPRYDPPPRPVDKKIEEAENAEFEKKQEEEK